MSSSPIGPERIGETTAKRLLERAAELDENKLTLGQLRDAAIEAGIAPSAFDEAVREWRRTRNLSPTRDSALPLSSRLLRNAAALTAGWVAISVFAGMDGLLTLPWLVHKLTDPVGLALGSVLALKLRARTAVTVLGGLTASQLVEFLLDLGSGTPAVHGFSAHISLMAAGIAAVAVGQRFWSSGQGPGLTGIDSSKGISPPRNDNASVEYRRAGLAIDMRDGTIGYPGVGSARCSPDIRARIVAAQA